MTATKKKTPEVEVITADELENKLDQDSVVVFNQTSAGLAAMRKQYDPKKIPDAGTAEGYEVIKKAVKTLTTTRTTLEKAKKVIKAPFLAFTKKVDGEYNRILAEVQEVEAPWKKAKQDQDEKEAREKQEREDRARGKIDQTMTMVLDTARGESSGVVASYIEAVDAIDVDDFYPLRDEATKEKARVLDGLGKLYQDKLEQEAAQEAAAKAEIGTRIEKLKGTPAEYFSKTIQEIEQKLEQLRGVTQSWCKQEFGERAGEAWEALATVVQNMEQLLEMKKPSAPKEEAPAEVPTTKGGKRKAAAAPASVVQDPEADLPAPEAKDLVECIAEAYEVLEDTARRWLRETEF